MKQQLRPFSAMIFVLGVAMLFLISCATTTDFATGQQTRNLYTVKDDIKMGNQTFEEIKVQMAKDGTAVPSRNKADVRRVKEIADRIFAATGEQDTFAFNVELFESKVVNAFAVPGGQVAVFTGIWDPKEGLVTDDDELAAVLAHEVGHVICRHSTEAMTRQMPTQLLLAGAGLFAESRKNETWKSVVDGAFIMYNGLVVPKYSRADEFEADRVSMVYMARAGFDPAAAVRLWKRAYEKEGNEPSYMSILATHPSNKARYEALQRQLPGVLAERSLLATASIGPLEQTATATAKPAVEKTATAKTIFAPAPVSVSAPSASAPPKAHLPPATSAPMGSSPRK